MEVRKEIFVSRRWRLQFSLRLVIGAITVSAVLLGVRMYDAAGEAGHGEGFALQQEESPCWGGLRHRA